MTSKLRSFSLGCVAAVLLGSAQAAVVLLDFETIGIAAPSTGTAVGATFSNAGLSFSGNALAFHNGLASGNDSLTAIATRTNNFGYVRSPFSNSLPTGGPGFSSFTIHIAAGKNYDKFALTLGVSTVGVDIYAYGAGSTTPLNTGGIHTFSNTGGFAWAATPYLLVDGSTNTNIDRITFNVATSGLFAIDDLQFTTAGTGGGTVPEPAGLGLVALALAAAGVASRRTKPA